MNAMCESWLIANQKKFDQQSLVLIRQKMANMTDEKAALVCSVQLKDPMTFVLITWFVGIFGVHRFMLGEVGMGVFELLTCGCCGILSIIDLFTIMGKVRKANFDAVVPYLV